VILDVPQLFANFQQQFVNFFVAQVLSKQLRKLIIRQFSKRLFQVAEGVNERL